MMTSGGRNHQFKKDGSFLVVVVLVMTMMMMTMMNSSPSLFFVHAGTTQEGLDYLAENAKKEGVVVLDSGLQYKVLKSGTGSYHPQPYTPCLCHYRGTTIDGNQFDSSYDRGEPTTFAPNQVIKGWTEAMQLMVEGDKWEMTIPSELAYGDSGAGADIPGGAVLIFTMELIEIQADTESDKVLAMKCHVEDLSGCDERQQKYIAKMFAETKSNEDRKNELERLTKMKGSKMKPDLRTWLNQRIHILKQDKTKEEEEGDAAGEL